MKTYYIFRHGLTYFSKNHLPYGDNEDFAQILDEGKPAIRSIGEYFKENRIKGVGLSSEYLRVRQTTEIVTAISGQEFAQDPRLNEYRDESFEEFRQRMAKFVAWLRDLDDEIIILCTHGACISALKYLLTTNKFERENLLDYPDSGIILKLMDSKNQVEVIDFSSNA